MALNFISLLINAAKQFSFMCFLVIGLVVTDYKKVGTEVTVESRKNFIQRYTNQWFLKQ